MAADDLQIVRYEARSAEKEALKEIIVENGANGVMQPDRILHAMVTKLLGQGMVRAYMAAVRFLKEPENYVVATIANAKARGALGHHIFIQYEDGTISEWAGPATKSSYPKSQVELRETTRAQVARIRMAARKHGGHGAQARYIHLWNSADRAITFQGYPYAPWYQDCFHWVDNVLTEAGEPKNTNLVRLSSGVVGLLSGVLAVAALGTLFLARGRS